MLIFTTIILIPLFVLFVKNEKIISKVALFIIIAMILLNGLRGLEVGTDTIQYYNMYTNSTVSDRIEPLFRLVVNISKHCGLSFTGFLVVVAIMIYIPLFVFIKKWSPNQCLSLVVYMSLSPFFFQNSYNVLRNAIAASLLLCGIGYLSSKDYKKASLLIISSIGFHYTALLATLFVLLSTYFRNLKTVVAFLILLLSSIIGLTTTFYSNVLSLALSQISILSGSVYDNYYNLLIDASEIDLNTNGIIMLIAPMSVISVISFLGKKVDLYLRAVLFCGSVLSNLFVSVLYTYRLTTFMTLLCIVIVPQLFNESSKTIKYATLFIVFVMSAYYISGLLYETNTNILPYSFYFEH